MNTKHPSLIRKEREAEIFLSGQRQMLTTLLSGRLGDHAQSFVSRIDAAEEPTLTQLGTVLVGTYTDDLHLWKALDAVLASQ